MRTPGAALTLTIRIREDQIVHARHGEATVAIRRHLVNPNALSIHPAPGVTIDGRPADRNRLVLPLSSDRGPPVALGRGGDILRISRGDAPGRFTFELSGDWELRRG